VSARLARVVCDEVMARDPTRPRFVAGASVGTDQSYSVVGWMDGWWCRYILIAGSIKVRKRMMKGDYGAAMDIAKKQVEDGAHAMDINVVDDGMLDGLSAMQKFVKIAVTEPEIAQVGTIHVGCIEI
jgi:hypothetical protein